MGTASDPLGWLGSVLESKYRIDAFVGSGGFGYVYRGTHLRLGKPVAVKFLRPELASGHDKQRKFLVRFLAEGRILHDLSRATAGVVQALDLGAANSPEGLWAPFLVMEWIDGPTLADERAYRSDDALQCRDRALDLETRPSLRGDRSLDAALRRMLAVDPRNRPSSASELRQLLSSPSASRSSSSTTTDAGSMPAASKPTRRGFPWVWLAGGLALVVGGVVGLGFGIGVSTPEHADAGPPVSSSVSKVESRDERARRVFAQWDHAERERNASAIGACVADSMCFYGGRRSRQEVVSALEALYAKSPSYSQRTITDSVRVILLDASDRARIEFEKVYNMDGKHEQRTRAYLVVDGAGKVITESDEVSDNNLLKSGGGEKDCRVGAPW